MNETTTSIYAKLGQVMRAIKAIDKSQKNQQQGFMFRGIDDFMNNLHDLLADAGIIIIPSESEHIQEQFTTKNGTAQFRTRLHMTFTFASTEDGSSVKADGWGEAADSGDKGYNKCKSIALKYVLMQMFLVPTKDIADPDRETPEEVKAKADDPDLELAIDDARRAASVDALTIVWNNWQGYQSNPEFYKAVQTRNKQLTGK